MSTDASPLSLPEVGLKHRSADVLVRMFPSLIFRMED
jgi:hypothetical protein